MLMLNIAKNIDRERFDISVCCLSEKGALGNQIEEHGIEVASLGFGKPGGLNISLLCRLRKFIKGKKIDIVHTHMYHANLYGRVAARLAGIPVVFSSVHNIYRKRKPHRMFINYLLSKITDKIFVGTPAVMEDVKRYDHVPEDRIEVLPYGIDTDIFGETHDRHTIRERLGISTGDLVIGNVARLEEAKGQKFLIEAVRILKERGLSIKCLIIGSGSLEKGLKEITQRNKLEDCIFFLGTRQDLPELFSAMDIFVFPSLWEGLPLALLSAMAAGLPVITTNAGGIKDIIVNGKNGIAVLTGDALSIADAVERIFRDAEMRKMLSENARSDVIRHHSAKAMTKRLEDKYELLIRN
jgi:glycosyltransferase involved in cell wall biosynthesis